MTACLTPTSCLWQVFSTPARWDCLVLKHHFSVLSEISIFRLSDSIIYPFTSDMSFFFFTFSHIFIHRSSEWLCGFGCVSVCVCVYVGVSVNLTVQFWYSAEQHLSSANLFFVSPACSTGRCSFCVCIGLCVYHYDNPCMNLPDSISSLSEHFLSSSCAYSSQIY